MEYRSCKYNVAFKLQRLLEFALQKTGPIELGRWEHLQLLNIKIRLHLLIQKQKIKLSC